jgi:mannose/cellobiose epimerase-like protein (N-acyl-D-glucosamine 2-epimerase family)
MPRQVYFYVARRQSGRGDGALVAARGIALDVGAGRLGYGMGLVAARRIAQRIAVRSEGHI